MKPPVVALVLAGGTGSRMGAELPKQLLRLGDKEILAHSLDAFESCPAVDEVRVFMAEGFVDQARGVVARYGHDKVREVLPGGKDRAESARVALARLAEHPPDTKVLVHDAVRPLLGAGLVADCVSILDEYDAATVAVPSTDTIVEVSEADGREVIAAIPNRATLRRCQTPQAFRLEVLARAHERAVADPDFAPTDDCGVVHRYLSHVRIGIVPGGEHNLKITHAHDLHLAEYHLHNRTQ